MDGAVMDQSVRPETPARQYLFRKEAGTSTTVAFFRRFLNPWATMIRRSWTQAASIEETLALWAASLRKIKKRIRPLFNQDRVARNAGLFLESLLGDEQRKTGWMRAEAAGDPGPWRQQAILGRRTAFQKILLVFWGRVSHQFDSPF